MGIEVVGRHLLAVVNPARDDRPVGIAFQELNDHLLPDARDEHPPPAPTGPHLGDAHPAGALLVLLSVPIPVKLDSHSTIFVRRHLLPLLPHHDGGLRTTYVRLCRGAPTPVRPATIHGCKAAMER